MTIPSRIAIAVIVSCSVVVGLLIFINADRHFPNVRVQFVNRDVGWIVGPRLLQTSDGGRTWKEIRSDGYGTLTSESIGFGHRQIQFITPASGVQLDLNKTDFYAENQFQRNKKLFDAGNIPLTKFQDIEYKYQGSQADYLNAQIELDRVEAEYLDKISKAESDLSNTRAEAFDTEVDIIKSRNELTNTQIRSGQYQIVAPQDGYIVKAMKAGIGETVKEGDAICTIMPEVSDMAVEMYVKAMDVPLISKGRNVRIQFDGWPALQFSGWPSVSVGTFGGEVKVIDYVNSKPGEFRILVVPDSKDESWPTQLRNGSGTKGWVMLDSVPIWYELWRQLNGFPPSLYAAPSTAGNATVLDEVKVNQQL